MKVWILTVEGWTHDPVLGVFDSLELADEAADRFAALSGNQVNYCEYTVNFIDELRVGP